MRATRAVIAIPLLAIGVLAAGCSHHHRDTGASVGQVKAAFAAHGQPLRRGPPDFTFMVVPSPAWDLAKPHVLATLYNDKSAGKTLSILLLLVFDSPQSAADAELTIPDLASRPGRKLRVGSSGFVLRIRNVIAKGGFDRRADVRRTLSELPR